MEKIFLKEPIIIKNVLANVELFEYGNTTQFDHKWSYTVSSNRTGLNGLVETHKFWGINLLNKVTGYYNDLCPYWLPPLPFYLDEQTDHKFKLRQRRIESCHINGQTYGQDGHFHHDKDYTIMLFLNYMWQKDWGGEMAYIDSNGNEKMIDYVPGSCVILSENIMHRGLAPTVKDVLRMTLTIHLGEL